MIALPGVVDALPARPPDVPVTELVRRARASDQVPYTAYGESVGRLPLPDAGALDEVSDLLGDRTRLRAWWVSPERHRVDVISAIGERDTYVRPGRRLRWDSFERRVQIVVGPGGRVHLPQPGDLLAPALGRRLLGGAGPGEITLGDTDRIAGHDTATLVVTPADRRTLVARIEVAVEPRTGLPLRVAVFAHGRDQPDMESRLFDLSLRRPARRLLTFRTPLDARVETLDSFNADELAERLPYELPSRVAGLPRRAEVGGGAGSYGTGYSILAVVPLTSGFAYRLQDQLRSIRAEPVEGPYGEGFLLQGQLLTAMAFTAPDGAGYLLVGSVRREVVERAARQLVQFRSEGHDG